MKKIRDTILYWKYLGHTKEQLEQFEQRVSKENLQILNQIEIIVLAIVLFCAIGSSFMARMDDDYNSILLTTERILGSVALIDGFLFCLSHHYKTHQSSYRLSGWLTTIFQIIVCVPVLFVSTALNQDGQAILICGSFLVVQVMFYAYPKDNLIFIGSYFCVFLIVDLYLKTPFLVVADISNSIPFLIIGLFLSWTRARLKWENLVRADAELKLQAQSMENELIQSRITVMLSQIQPHFLYNTLDGIGELCYCDPQRAEEMITHLAQFLRGNIAALTENKNIPFEQELDYTRNYLDLEKMRFNERLNVIYDIQSTQFFLPTLTIQPVVENAVRCGIMKKVEGGTITIATTETVGDYIIIIKDDGVGFDVNEINPYKNQCETMELKHVEATGQDIEHSEHDYKEHPHIGLQNVIRRVQLQSHGRVEIHSAKNAGTKIQIFIPKEEKIDETKDIIIR